MTKLIVISSEPDLENEVDLVNALFMEGMGQFHLRKPKWDLKLQSEFLEKINSEFLNRVSVHQNYQTVETFGLKYCHMKGIERSGKIERKTGLMYSGSFHDTKTLDAHGQLFDYCFLSPLFNSISKPGYHSAFSENFILESDHPKVYALGGITKNNIHLVFEKGFYGAAVLGTLWNDGGNAVENFTELNKICKASALMC